MQRPWGGSRTSESEEQIKGPLWPEWSVQGGDGEEQGQGGAGLVAECLPGVWRTWAFSYGRWGPWRAGHIWGSTDIPAHTSDMAVCTMCPPNFPPIFKYFGKIHITKCAILALYRYRSRWHQIHP